MSELGPNFIVLPAGPEAEAARLIGLPVVIMETEPVADVVNVPVALNEKGQPTTLAKQGPAEAMNRQARRAYAAQARMKRSPLIMRD